MIKEPIAISEISSESSLYTDGEHFITQKETNATPKGTALTFNQIGGGICAFIVVVDWVAMSEVFPRLQKDTNYVKPYLLRYVIGSTASLMFIPWFFLNGRRCNAKITWPMLASSFGVWLLYHMDTYLWYLSLNATIAAINNTIYQSSIAFAYIFSVILLPNYNMSWIKNLGVLCCLTGVTVVGLGTDNESDDDETNTWYGIVEVLVSMLFWGLTEVLLSVVGTKYYNNIGNGPITPFNKVISKLFMQGVMGTICLCTFWTVIPILHYLGIEEFRFPENMDEAIVLLVPAMMDTVFCSALVIGISLTSPVFMAVAQLLVIPVGFMYDSCFNGLEIEAMAILGSVFIFIGFLIMELPVQSYIAIWTGRRSSCSSDKTKSLVHSHSVQSARWTEEHKE